MWFSYLVGPAVGAVIGYITNDIAIRMLFKPHHPVYILGWHLPFTPGIIPKEKSRIAASVAGAVSDNLINQEALEKSLLSNEMIDKLGQAIDRFVDEQAHNEASLQEWASQYLTTDDLEAIKRNLSDNVTRAVSDKLGQTSVGQQVAHMAVEHVMDKAKHSLAGKLGGDHLLGLVTSPLEKMLAKHINEVLQHNAPTMVASLVNDTTTQLMNQPMSHLIGDHPEQVVQAKSAIINAYRTVIQEHLPRILQAIDIRRIVETRIAEMDMDEAERIILSVMKKELRAIVWLGALLGCLMGCVTTLVNL